MTENWQEMARSAVIDGRALINGDRVIPEKSEFDLVSPGSSEVIASVGVCSSWQVERALAYAAESFPAWADTSPADRGRVVGRWADLIEQNSDELSLLLTLETGKPVRAARDVEVRSLIRSVRWYSEIAGKLSGSYSEGGIGETAFVSRHPVGTVAVVLPWNFPLSMVGFDVAPALVAGNAVIVKPAPSAPLAVLRACELAVDAGVPEGVLAVLLDEGQSVGSLLGSHPAVSVVCVTGGAAAGRAYASYAALGSPKRIWPKLGGKSIAAVSSDCGDVEHAIEALSWAAFFNQGAMCTGASRILVEDGIFDDFVGMFARRTEALVTGDPLSLASDVGAMHSASLAAGATDVLREALTEGFELVSGTGEIFAVENLGGTYMKPVIVQGDRWSSRIMQEEVFAPVCVLTRCAQIEEIVQRVQQVGTGMAVSVWTEGISRALSIAKKCAVGTVWINSFEGDDLTVPFGGVGRSGYGRDKSLVAFDKYTDLRTTWIQLDKGSFW